MVQDKLAVMERLAADVAYLHGLRRVVPALVQRGEHWEMIEAVGESLLPAVMQSACRQRQCTPPTSHALYAIRRTHRRVPVYPNKPLCSERSG